jgi:hypothetical protein
MNESKPKRVERPATAEERARHAEIREKSCRSFRRWKARAVRNRRLEFRRKFVKRGRRWG